MTGKKRKIILSDFDYRLLVALLADYRNKLLQESRSTEDINDLLLKIIDTQKHKWWRLRWKSTYTMKRTDYTTN